jgi:hypothetical protein
MALALGMALVAVGCGDSHEGSRSDAAVDAGDAGEDAGGHWEACCQDGVVGTCFCPAGAACNFWYDDCGDGTCVFPGSGDPCPGDDAGVDAGDAGEADAGQWEPCCEEGVITTCYCPAETICNYGLFVDCGDGTCTHGDPCPMEM